MKFLKYQQRGRYHFNLYNNRVEWYVKCVDEILKVCKGSTLDVGCGEGLVMYLLNKKGYRTTGIDNDIDAINMAKGLDVHFADLKQPILGKWKYLCCLNVIEHLERPERIVEIFRDNTTKAGIIITDKRQPTLGKYHIHEFTKEELMELFKDYKPDYFEPVEGFMGVRIYK